VNPEKASTDSFRGIFFVLFRGLSTNHRRRFRRSGARGKLADEESRQTLGLKPQESRYFAKAVKKFHSGGFC
jgi:hypothetical protein